MKKFFRRESLITSKNIFKSKMKYFLSATLGNRLNSDLIIRISGEKYELNLNLETCKCTNNQQTDFRQYLLLYKIFFTLFIILYLIALVTSSLAVKLKNIKSIFF